MDRSRAAAEVFNKRAAIYQQKFMNVDRYADSLHTFCARLSPLHGARVLDVACGPGNIAKHLLGIRPDLDILGIDLSANMLTLARANVPLAQFIQMDCREMNSLTGGFDGIICGFYFPYLSRAEAIRSITDAAAMLQPGGVLYISTMQGEYSSSGYKTSGSGDQVYVNYHELAYLAAAMEQNGLGQLAVQRQEYDGIVDLIMIAVKG